MQKIHTFWGRLLAIFVMASFVFNMSAFSALAQDEEVTVAEEVEALSVPNEVVQDSTVTAEDLGVKDQNVLPGDLLYPVKEVWREVKHIVTFSDIGDANLDLRYSSEKLIEAQNLAAEGSMENLESAIDNYQEEVGDFNAEMDEVAENDEDAGTLSQLQSDAVSVHVEQTVILDNLEEEVSEETFIEIRDAKEDAAEGVAKALTLSGDGENGEAWQQLIADAATSGEGSSLRNLKVLEVLKSVGDRVPEEAREAIEGAQDNILKKFEHDFEDIPQEVRLKKMEGYMRHMKGDETNRLRMLDKMKFDGKLPEEVLQHIEVMKAKAVEHFNNRMKDFDSPEAREKMFERLQKGDLESVRVLDDLKAHALDEEVRQKIDQHHTEGIAKFREAFQGDKKALGVADRVEELMRQVRDNPDPKTFRLLEELRNELSPEQQAFVAGMENAGKEEMQKRFSEEKEKFMSRMNSINPEDLAYMGDFQKDFAPELGADFSRDFKQTIEFSKDGIEDRVRSFDRPEDVEKFKQIFEAGSDDARRAIQSSIPNFDSFVEKQRGEIESKFKQREEFIRESRGNSEDEQQLREKFRMEFGKDFGIAPGEKDIDPFRGIPQRGGQNEPESRKPGQSQESNIPSDDELRRKVERENPGLNEEERKAFLNREKEQLQDEQKREPEQQRQFPGGGATQGRFPGQGSEGSFPPTENHGGTFDPSRAGTSVGGGFKPDIGASEGGGFGQPGPSGPGPAEGGGGSGGFSAPGPTSFNPLGLLGQVLGISFRK